MVKQRPDGYHALTPSIAFKDTQKAIDFYKKAFGAKVLDMFPSPIGPGIMHATIQIGDSIIMMGDENPNCPSAQSMGGKSPISLFLYVPDADAAFKQAVAAGAAVAMPVIDQFWGDRYVMLADPFGHRWQLATHKEDLTPEQIKTRSEQFFAAQAKR